MPPTLDEFRGFFHAKAFDVVGNGAYRKHLARCKETGDHWAVTMGAQIHAIQTHIREVQTAVQDMPRSSDRLPEICRDVMMSAQPPIRLFAGHAECAITHRRCTRCLDLSRAQKGHASVYVDMRFCRFFMLLWYCNKLEYIIRSYTRTWLDLHQAEAETFRDLCTTMCAEQEPTIVRMHALLALGLDHVLATLQQHTHANVHAPVLCMATPAPPAIAPDEKKGANGDGSSPLAVHDPVPPPCCSGTDAPPSPST
jgi:hypothetical protein